MDTAVQQEDQVVPYLVVRPMSADKALQALPLAQALRADLTLCHWKAFCDSHCRPVRPDQGIDCALDRDGYVQGFFAYSTRPDLRHGPLLSIDPFVAVDLFGRAYAARFMLDRIDTLVERLACAAVHINMDAAGGRFPQECGSRLVPYLEHGYRADGMRLCKSLK